MSRLSEKERAAWLRQHARWDSGHRRAEALERRARHQQLKDTGVSDQIIAEQRMKGFVRRHCSDESVANGAGMFASIVFGTLVLLALFAEAIAVAAITYGISALLVLSGRVRRLVPWPYLVAALVVGVVGWFFVDLDRVWAPTYWPDRFALNVNSAAYWPARWWFEATLGLALAAATVRRFGWAGVKPSVLEADLAALAGDDGFAFDFPEDDTLPSPAETLADEDYDLSSPEWDDEADMDLVFDDEDDSEREAV